MIKRSVTVAVTGLNNIDSPGPGIPVIRGLRESRLFDVRIIGLAYENLEPGLYMRELVDKTYIIPHPSSGSDLLMNRLAYIQQQEHIDVLIPNFDAELFNFILLAQRMRDELHIAMFLPDKQGFEARHKHVLDTFGEQHGILVPKNKTISSATELFSAGDDMGYPLVVKGKFYDAYIAASHEQAIGYFHKMSAKWGLPVVLQEFIAGDEVNVTAIGDGRGECLGAVPMRKLYITDKGKAWAGISLDDPDLVEIASDIVRKSKWRGGCELEFIRDKDDKYYLLEMNPRFPAWVYLAVACGQNHPEALVQLALGEQPEPWEGFQSGKLFIRYSFDQIVDIKDFETISMRNEL
jgi:carbamoyl-phosphate synthase large subunit